jgi:hypothetical protein
MKWIRLIRILQTAQKKLDLTKNCSMSFKKGTIRSLPIGTLRTKRKKTHFAKYFGKICLQTVRGLDRPVVTTLKHKVDFKTIHQVPIKMNRISVKKLIPLVYRFETIVHPFFPLERLMLGELNEQMPVRANGLLRFNCLIVLRRCP